MKDYIKKLLNQYGLRLSLIFIAIVICLNALLVIYFRDVMVRSSEISRQVLQVRDGINQIESHIHLGDLGVRAYLIKPTDDFLAPYVTAREGYLENLESLEANLDALDFDITLMAPATNTITEYMGVLKLIVDLCNDGKKNEALEIFYEDRGYDAWQRYAPFLDAANAFIEDVSAQSEQKYRSSINLILFIQIILIILSVPIIVIAYWKIKKNGIFRKQIFKLIDTSNRKYLFDDGKSEGEQNEDTITEHLISNLKKAASFIKNITKENYEISWDSLSHENMHINKSNIAGELSMMRDQMQKAKKEDEIRIWMNEGLSKFADLIRKHQDDIHELAEQLVSNIVQYLGAQQGGLFFVSEDTNQKKFLEMMGCYAYERKKFLQKRIEIGQGMVGQCFLEGETTYVTNIPDEYVAITSGLGMTNPSTLLIVPLKVNEEVVGVMEIASVKEIEKYKIDFIERLAETIASSISSVKINESTRDLLEQSQQQAEEMRAQEEEMRQNMEELQATQEQMSRKNEEVETLLKNVSKNEDAIKEQNKMILEEKSALEVEDAILSTLMEVIPDRVTIKDKTGKYLKVSNSKLKSLKEMGFNIVIGKSDKDMFGSDHFKKSLKAEKEIMTKGKIVMGLEEQIEISKGVKIWGSTSRIPLKNKKGEVIGTVVITRDITKEKECQDELRLIKSKN